MRIARVACAAWSIASPLLALFNLGNAQAQTSAPLAGTCQQFESLIKDSSRTVLGKLDQRGISFQGVFVYDWSKTINADQDSTPGFGRHSFDLSMPVDGRKLFGLDGTDGLVRIKNHLNNFGETYSREAQIYSNIDASSRTTLYEIWIEHRFFNDRLRLKGGKIDANTEFAVVRGSGDFLNSSMGYSPTIMALPTYPEPKLGMSAFFHPIHRYGVGLGLGVFQTAGSGTFSMVEPGEEWHAGAGELPGRVSFGYWRLDGKIARFDGSEASGSQGFYSVMEQSVLRQPLEQGERRITTFLQVGWADGAVSPFTRHVGGGAVLQGPFRKRSDDGIGVAATWVHLSSDPNAEFDRPTELTLESYYKVSFNKHVALVQDFQYLHHPGGASSNPDCPVVTPRLVISF